MLINPSPLPPRGVFVPTSMLFHSELPSAVLITWIQLRALAWLGWSTPAMTLAEFASILAIHPSRLSKHLDHLLSASALSLRSNGSGKLIVTFHEQPMAERDEFPHSYHLPSTPISKPHERELNPPASYFPQQILGYLTFTDEKNIHTDQDQPGPAIAQPDKASVSLERLDSLCYQEVT